MRHDKKYVGRIPRTVKRKKLSKMGFKQSFASTKVHPRMIPAPEVPELTARLKLEIRRISNFFVFLCNRPNQTKPNQNCPLILFNRGQLNNFGISFNQKGFRPPATLEHRFNKVNNGSDHIEWGSGVGEAIGGNRLKQR
jgi:hypothetical protein